MWHPWKKLFNVRHLSHFLGGKTPESHMSLHGTGEGDDALVNFHANLRFTHARIPAEFAQHRLMDVFVTLPHHDTTSFPTRARPLWPPFAVSEQTIRRRRHDALARGRHRLHDPECKRLAKRKRRRNAGGPLEWDIREGTSCPASAHGVLDIVAYWSPSHALVFIGQAQRCRARRSYILAGLLHSERAGALQGGTVHVSSRWRSMPSAGSLLIAVRYSSGNGRHHVEERGSVLSMRQPQDWD